MLNLSRKLQLPLGAFFLLVLNYLIPKLTSNQENYYGLAKQYINPNWIPHSFSFNEFVGTRYLFQVIVGYPLQFFSFEAVHLVFTTVGLFLLAFPFARIFEYCKISVEWSLVLMGLLFFSSMGSGAFWAGEWIFGGFEAKTLAYVFVLWSIFSFFKRDLKVALLLTIPATYFHFLVGGYAFCFIASYAFIVDKEYKKIMKMSLVYLLFAIPFILFLYLNGFKNVEVNVEHTKTANWIYSIFRNPHHTAIFSNSEIFKDKIFPGIIKAFSCFLILLTLLIKRKKYVDENVIRVSKFSLYCLLVLFFFLGVCYLDKEGSISKLYLFRFGAVAKFLTIMSIFLFVPQINFLNNKKTQVVAVSIVFLLGLIRFNKNFIQVLPELKKTDSYKVALKAKEISHPGDIFLYFETDNEVPTDGFESFIRNSERDLFVSYKFVPAEKSEMLVWYQRILDTNKLKAGEIDIFQFLEKYPQVNYVITEDVFPLELLSTINTYKIYKRNI